MHWLGADAGITVRSIIDLEVDFGVLKIFVSTAEMKMETFVEKLVLINTKRIMDACKSRPRASSEEKKRLLEAKLNILQCWSCILRYMRLEIENIIGSLD